MTLNCGGQIPESVNDILPMFQSQEKGFYPDMYIIGFQEIVKLNAKNVLISNDNKRIEYWRSILIKTFQKINE